MIGMFVNKEGLKVADIHKIYHLALSCLQESFENEDIEAFMDIMQLNLLRYEHIILHSGKVAFMDNDIHLKSFDFILRELFESENKILQAKIIIYGIFDTLSDMDIKPEDVLALSTELENKIYQAFSTD